MVLIVAGFAQKWAGNLKQRNFLNNNSLNLSYSRCFLILVKFQSFNQNFESFQRNFCSMSRNLLLLKEMFTWLTTSLLYTLCYRVKYSAQKLYRTSLCVFLVPVFSQMWGFLRSWLLYKMVQSKSATRDMNHHLSTFLSSSFCPCHLDWLQCTASKKHAHEMRMFTIHIIILFL